MNIIDTMEQFYIKEDTAVAIGKFDGIHLGHQALLQKIIHARENGLKAAVFTFYPSPAAVFSPDESFCSLSTREEKRSRMEALGIDYYVEYPMNPATASIDPEEFIRSILAERMHARMVAAGPDLSFGRQGKGNFELLRQYEEKYHYKAVQIDKVCMDGKEISSSMVREAVERGDMEMAEKCLGGWYGITGIVCHGKENGRRFGYPTLNLVPEKEKLLPPYGVYYSRTQIDGKWHHGLTNIGKKPTVQEEGEITVETFLLEYQEMAYDRQAVVELMKYARPEQKFDGEESLVRRIEKDVQLAKDYFKNKML